MVNQKHDSPLNFALLGLLWLEPRSGYDLRKFFSTTPLISFSDSPGAIYPALQRLERRALLRGAVDKTPGRRGRRLYTLTAHGRAEFKRRQQQPVTRYDILRNPDHLMLRFAFMDQSADKTRAIRFLKSLQQQLAAYLPTLHQYFRSNRKYMPLSGRLALEFGIKDFEARLRWAKSSLAVYQSVSPKSSVRHARKGNKT